jgi:hypothetical protein
MNMFKFKDFIHRLYHFEYWPFWVFYFPVFLLWPIFSLRGRSLLFFTAANPCIPHGGCFGESKIDILRKIPSSNIPHTFFVDESLKNEDFDLWFKSKNLNFPLVAKPDIGERGDNIRIVYSLIEIRDYKNNLGRPFLLQEFLESPFELGVMVICDPNTNEVRVTSIVSKIYMNVIGDGKSTIEELILSKARSRFQWERIKDEVDPDTILTLGQKLILEPIGNHKRGTTFINSNHLINPEIHKIFSDLVGHIDGFKIGRFDLKAPDEESFLKGQGIKVMELNGAFSEPGHIYDPDAKLWNAWKDLIMTWWVLAGISRANQKQGVSLTSFSEFFRLYIDYKKLRQLRPVHG